MEAGEFIDLRSHGGLCAPTEETLIYVLKCDEGFNLMHGEGARLKDCSNVIEKTECFIKELFADIPSDIISLFVKIKYHARIRSLNEEEVVLRKEELKRRATARNEAPKRLKTMRDYSKESVSDGWLIIRASFNLLLILGWTLRRLNLSFKQCME